MPAERLRVFFALWPPPAAGAAAARLARGWAAQAGGRAMRPDTLHLTLAFVGEIESARLASLEFIGACAAAGAGGPFALTLDRPGWWAHNRIAWLGASAPPPALGGLVAGLRAGLAQGGFRVESRPFAAHLTLVRDAPRAPGGAAQPVAWEVSELLLMRSQLAASGASYAPLARWAL